MISGNTADLVRGGFRAEPMQTAAVILAACVGRGMRSRCVNCTQTPETIIAVSAGAETRMDFPAGGTIPMLILKHARRLAGKKKMSYVCFT